MRPVLRWFLLVLGGLASGALSGVVYFAAAGRLDLPFAWAAFAVLGAMSAAGGLLADPGLLHERRHPGPGATDRALPRRSRLLGLAGLVLAGLDVGRLHWSDAVPMPLQAAGVAMLASGFALALWAMAVNRFFSSVIRLQEDRGHELVTQGPYRLVRHPGYTGVLLGMPGLALALDSWLALLPLLGFAALIVRRLLLEDRFLHERLAGYPDYARRVRFRLFPGLW